MDEYFGTEALVKQFVKITVGEVETGTGTPIALFKARTDWRFKIKVETAFYIEMEVETDCEGVRYYERKADELPVGLINLFYQALSPLLLELVGVTIRQGDFTRAIENLTCPEVHKLPHIQEAPTPKPAPVPIVRTQNHSGTGDNVGGNQVVMG